MMHWPLIRNLPKETHFKFVSLAPFAAGLSALCVLASIFSFVTIGLNLGIDFKGGTLMEVQTVGPAPLGPLRAALTGMGVKDAQVQGFGAPSSARLRFEPLAAQDSAKGVGLIEAKLAQQFPGIKFTDVEYVGPNVSGELFQGGLMALGTAIVLMLGYI